MAISTGSFVNPNSLPPMDKLAQDIASPILGGLGDGASSIAAGSASSLLGAGISSDSVQQATALQVDGIVGGGDPHYTAQAGKVTNRATQADLTSARSATSPDRPSGALYSLQVSPQGKINAATLEASENVFDVFPPDIGKYKIYFEFMNYSRPAPFANSTSEIDYTVVLPVPAQLVEYYEADWQTSNLGLIGDLADAFQQRNNVGLGDVAGEVVGAQALRIAESQEGALAGAATVAQQAMGVAPNPNITVAFKGPKLRAHNMSWTFAPKTPDESLTVQRIIRNIKRRILPTTGGGANDSTAVLGYPMMVQPKLLPVVKNDPDTPDSSLYDFKRCVIQNLSVNYAPTGTPTFFRGTNLPVFVQMSFTLLEIEYFLSDMERAPPTGRSAELGNELTDIMKDGKSQDVYNKATPPEQTGQ